MTLRQIEKRQAADNLRFETAKEILLLLEKAEKAMGNLWTDDTRDEILALVTDEE